MDLLMVATELGPYARATEVGDAVPALGKALKQLGHRVTVALPRYGAFEAHGLMLARRLTPLPAPGGDVVVYDCQLASGVELVLFDVPGLTEPPASPDARPELFAAGMELGRAVAALLRQRGRDQTFDVVHAHGPLAGLVAAHLEGGRPPFVLTMYDAAQPAWFDDRVLANLDPALSAKLRVGGRACALAMALGDADLVLTPSASHAASLTDPSVTGALAERFSALSEPVVGVPTGLDYATHNPAVDASLEARYDAEDAWLKARTKGVILREHRLDLDIGPPLVVFPGPLDAAHGADVLLESLPSLARERLSLIVAEGEGDPLLEAFRNVRQTQPDAFALAAPRDDAAFRRLIAAADIVLLPTRAAPSEMTHAIAQRYGALPVALATGSSLDGIVDTDSSLETGTGFLFDRLEVRELLGALGRALAAYADEDGWQRLRRRVMRLDLGWDRPARRHAQLYRRLSER